MMYFFTRAASPTQWQELPAQPVPQAAADAAGAAAGAASAALLATAGALVLAAPPLKSVAYQPEPLSWKPAAVICLLNASAWQAGQVVNGASESF